MSPIRRPISILTVDQALQNVYFLNLFSRGFGLFSRVEVYLTGCPKRAALSPLLIPIPKNRPIRHRQMQGNHNGHRENIIHIRRFRRVLLRITNRLIVKMLESAMMLKTLDQFMPEPPVKIDFAQSPYHRTKPCHNRARAVRKLKNCKKVFDF